MRDRVRHERENTPEFCPYLGEAVRGYYKLRRFAFLPRSYDKDNDRSVIQFGRKHTSRAALAKLPLAA